MEPSRAKEPGPLSNNSASEACPSQTVSVCPAHPPGCWGPVPCVLMAAGKGPRPLDWAEAGLVTAGHGHALSVGRWLSAHVGTRSSCHSKGGK